MKDKSLSFKIILGILIGLLSLGLIFGIYFVFKTDFKIKNFKKEITFEYNSKYKNKYGNICYGNLLSCKKVKIKIDGKVNTKKLGKYKIKYTYLYKNKKLNLNQTVYVKDTTPPKVTINTKEVLVCPNNKIGNIDLKIKDNYDKEIKNIKKTFDKEKNIVTIKVVDSNKNITTKKIKAKVEDKTPPEIKLNGNENVYIYVGGTYTDEGATATDNCDEVSVETSNDINNTVAGTYHITYTSVDKNNNKAEIKRNIIVRNRPYGKRIVYLTFDDGPSEYTNKLLDILKKYNVKVTFFVTGKGEDSVILREYKEGHKIALHTNSHNYATVYSSVDNYFNDLNAISSRVERITGYKSKLIRFPGGSSNTVSRSYSRGIMSTLTREVQNRGYKYFDWNISSGDAGGTTTSDGVYNNVVTRLKDDYSVVLQHDTQEFSIDAVERIIKYGLENGYTFSVLDENSPGAHHGVNN